jgi:hypothetical protein
MLHLLAALTASLAPSEDTNSDKANYDAPLIDAEQECLHILIAAAAFPSLMRVKSTNVQDEGLQIGGIGRRMNSKVKISQTRRVLRINVVVNLA